MGVSLCWIKHTFKLVLALYHLTKVGEELLVEEKGLLWLTLWRFIVQDWVALLVW